MGSRVRLQDVKTKLFSTNGTVLEHRNTDSGDIVSYIIRTDRGRLTTRHRLDNPIADRDILENVATELKATDRSDSGYDSREEVVQRI